MFPDPKCVLMTGAASTTAVTKAAEAVNGVTAEELAEEDEMAEKIEKMRFYCIVHISSVNGCPSMVLQIQIQVHLVKKLW